MTKFLLTPLISLVLFALSSPSLSDNAVSDEQKSALLSKLQAARPDLTFTGVRATADPALFEVEYNDGPIVYVTASGNFFLVGDLFTFKGGQIVNVSEQRKTEMRAELINDVKQSEMISFGPSLEEAKAELFVFTDVDCGFCRKLHNEIDELSAYGVRVSYLAYPRAGVASDVARKMNSAWCSADSKDALTKLKQGKSIPNQVCDSTAVADQFELGQRIGVTGTPALVTKDGSLIPGYRPAADLAAILGVK